MAIGYSPIVASPDYTAEGAGVGNYVEALRKGYETGNTPSKLTASLLEQHLSNAINRVKAQYAPRREETELAHLAAQTQGLGDEHSLRGLKQKLLQAKILKEDPNYRVDQAQKLLQLLSNPDKNEDPSSLQIIRPGESFIQGIPKNKKSSSDLDMQYIRNGLAYKALGLPVPHNSGYQGAARQAYDLQRLKNEYGENSPVYQDALRLSELNRENQESLSRQRDRRSSGLKPGENFVKNSQDEDIGISRDYSPSEKKEEKGRLFFNSVYPEILKSTGYYSGEGSVERFQSDVDNYKTDKSAQKRVDNYLAAVKLLPSALVKENATVGGANTNQVYKRLMDSLNSSDLGSFMKSVSKKLDVEQILKEYGLPMDAQIRSGKKFSELLNRATTQSKNVPARHTEYFDNKKRGHIYDSSTGKVKEVLVNPQHWDEFLKSGGY